MGDTLISINTYSNKRLDGTVCGYKDIQTGLGLDNPSVKAVLVVFPLLSQSGSLSVGKPGEL